MDTRPDPRQAERQERDDWTRFRPSYFRPFAHLTAADERDEEEVERYYQPHQPHTRPL